MIAPPEKKKSISGSGVKIKLSPEVGHVKNCLLVRTKEVEKLLNTGQQAFYKPFFSLQWIPMMVRLNTLHC